MALELIKTGGAPSHEIAEEMVEKIKAVVYEYDGRTSLPLALGVLEIVKAELIADHQ